MPKIALNPTQQLEERLHDIESQIQATSQELSEQESENIEFEKAIKLLSTGAAPFIPQGRIELMDAIASLLDQSSNEADRQYRWGVAQGR